MRIDSNQSKNRSGTTMGAFKAGKFGQKGKNLGSTLSGTSQGDAIRVSEVEEMI